MVVFLSRHVLAQDIPDFQAQRDNASRKSTHSGRSFFSEAAAPTLRLGHQPHGLDELSGGQPIADP